MEVRRAVPRRFWGKLKHRFSAIQGFLSDFSSRMTRRTIAGIFAGWGLAAAALLAISLAGCSSSSSLTTPATPPVTANFLVVSSSTNGHLPDAIANSPYSYGFQTNLGAPGVSARAPITFQPKSAMPPGLTLSTQGVLAGTPTQPGTFTVTVEALDSSPTPQTADFTYLMNVRKPGAALNAIAHIDLGGHGQNADVVEANAGSTGVPYAYIGTRGSPGDCPATGVKIVDLSQITAPALVATAGGVSGASQQEAKVAVGVTTPEFHPGSVGDLMAVTEQPCDPAAATGTQTGIQFFDVTDPTHPQYLGSWDSGVAGVSDVAILPMPAPANNVGQSNHALDKIYALAAVPDSEVDGTGEGDLRVLDITDPANPHEVGNWGVLASTGTLLVNAVMGYDQRVFLDSIELSSDRKVAYLSFWDEGVVALDVSNPLAIASNNPNLVLDHITYPITSIATTTTPAMPEGNTHEALPVDGDTALLVSDDICASAMQAGAASPSQQTPVNPAVGVVCGAGSAVPLTNNEGWGYVRTYALGSGASATLKGFADTPQSMSDPAPDDGIYTSHNLAWNGDTVHPHGYVAWMSSGVVDLDLTSIAPPSVLATFTPPDTPDPNGNNPAVDNPAKAMVYGVAAYNLNGQHYILASDINSGLWVVQEAPTTQLTILTTSLPDGNMNVPYSATLEAINGALGNSKIFWSLATGSNPLPSGLTLDGTGNITGTPEATGTVEVTFDATDDSGNESEQSINLTINQSFGIAPPTVPLGTTHEPLSFTILGVNGTPPYSWTALNNSLPAGMTLTSGPSQTEATISGSPTSSGTTVTTLQVTDSSPLAQVATLPIQITVQPLTVANPDLLQGDVGAAYQNVMKMDNGTGPYTPVVVSGALPPGLTATQDPASTLDWLISGTPTTAGVYNFGILVTDADGQSATVPLTLVVNPYELTPPVLQAAVEGRGYLQTLSAKGGTSPLILKLVLGQLPPGLTLNPDTGAISGVPASGSAGTYNFTLQATDANGLVTNGAYTLVVFSGTTFAITTTGLPPAQAGQSFSQVLTADFGTPPYKFSITAGALPPGITLDPNGTLAGVLGGSSAGTYGFTVQATDDTGLLASEHFTWTILPAVSPQ
jgi:hypothetical protein